MDTLSAGMIASLREGIETYQELSPDVIDLACAPHRDMMAFLSKRTTESEPLEIDQQLAIIERRNYKEICLLLDSEALYEEAGLELIETCGRRAVATFAKLQYSYNSTIKAMLKRGYYQEVDEAMENIADDLDEETISLLIEKKCEKALVTYINGFDEEDIENFPLSERNSMELVLSQMGEALSAYIAKSGFPYGVEQVFIEFGAENLVKDYVSCYKLFDESGVRLIERNNTDLVGTHILAHDFGAKAEMAFLQKGWHDLTMEYVLMHSLSEAGLLFLIEQKQEELLVAYQAHEILPPRAIISLIKSGMHQAIAVCFQTTPLPEGLQKILLHHGDVADINLYIDQRSLPEEIELELITLVELRGGVYKKILNRYLQKVDYYLYERAEIAWIMLGEKADVEIYIEKQRLSHKGEQNLIARGDSDLIKSYLKKYCPCKEAIEMLLKRGQKEEIKILLDNYYPQLDFEI